jgi:hypothetical protein
MAYGILFLLSQILIPYIKNVGGLTISLHVFIGKSQAIHVTGSEDR